MLTLRLIIPLLFLAPSISYAFCFNEAGDSFGINPSLLRSIAITESNFNHKAVNINTNGSRDIGLMQVNSSWVRGMGLDSIRLLNDPCYNVMTGARILKMCIDKYGYAWEAVGCYNAASRHKRVGYSWKIFKMLKAEGPPTHPSPSRGEGKGGGENSKHRTPNPSLVTLSLSKSNSSLSFSMRDIAAIE